MIYICVCVLYIYILLYIDIYIYIFVASGKGQSTFKGHVSEPFLPPLGVCRGQAFLDCRSGTSVVASIASRKTPENVISSR